MEGAARRKIERSLHRLAWKTPTAAVRQDTGTTLVLPLACAPHSAPPLFQEHSTHKMDPCCNALVLSCDPSFCEDLPG